MPHIQSSLDPELPAVNGRKIVDLSSLSTKESTTSAVTLVEPSNQDQRFCSTSRSGQYKSSGRGGVGNARAASDCIQRANILDGPGNFPSMNGREIRPLVRPDKIISTGRGGAGNVRSPSRDAIVARPSNVSSKMEAEQAKYERSLIRKHEAARATQMLSVGRGGAGNIVPSSPSRS
ncbi:hypothetical protein EI94DRAFT_1743602 [Lactarius quietus]|nr:hypothetical protein EI94DRAFT_1743602 [Lactarius quietus]